MQIDPDCGITPDTINYELFWKDQVRLFIATSLTTEVHLAIDSLLKNLRNSIDPQSVRWVKNTAMHVTLNFLGETPPKRIPDIKHSMDQVVEQFSRFPIMIEDLGCFPNLRRPRVLWLGITERSGALQNLQMNLAREMAKLGFPLEKRKFHPHLTLGRAKKGINNSDYRNIADQINQFPVQKIGQQFVESISLIQSDLRPSGPIYTTLHTAQFGGGE